MKKREKKVPNLYYYQVNLVNIFSMYNIVVFYIPETRTRSETRKAHKQNT